MFDPGEGDVIIRGTLENGSSVVPWTAVDSQGQAVPPGNYTAKVWLNVGEMHFMLADIENLWGGVRLFSFDPKTDQIDPVQMLWDNSRVVTGRNIDLISTYAILDSDLGGLSSGDPTDDNVCAYTTASGTPNALCWTANGDTKLGDKQGVDISAAMQSRPSFVEITVYDPAADLDSDGLTRALECGTYGTDPNNGDSDGDGRTDGVEVGVDGSGDVIPDAAPTSPTNPDSDGDGLPDGLEDGNGNGVVDPGETTPNNRDSDGDGLVDGFVDENSNGQVDPGEGEDTNLNGIQDDTESSPVAADSDGGGVPDGQEVRDGTSPAASGDDLTCGDGAQSGRETDVDCGGITCAACPSGGGCALPEDCGSGFAPMAFVPRRLVTTG